MNWTTTVNKSSKGVKELGNNRFEYEYLSHHRNSCRITVITKEVQE